jgi:amidohydrolase
MKKPYFLFLLVFLLSGTLLPAQSGPSEMIDERADDLEAKVIEWRRHFHQNPELSNREYETAKFVADHLEKLGMEVRTSIAHTGVKGILRGGRPGPVVALRADMDALPVVERAPVPFASTVKSKYLGQEVGVMHACGHDTHVAMLMGAAEILAGMKEALAGTVVFIFQPAEEGAPPGEKGGASLMVEEGVLKDPKVDAIFGLHINSKTEVGKIRYKPGGALAAADRFVIKVKGKQTHGSTPWSGVDPVTVSAQIIQGLQNIISRQTELTKEAAVISVGKIQGGVRNNIIPEEVELIGTIRTLDTGMQEEIHRRIRQTATNIAESAGAEAEVEITRAVPVTYNDPELTQAMLPTIQKTAGEENVILSNAITGAEDFSYYAQEVPGLFLFVGGMPKGKDPAEAAPHHTPDFYIDESGMKLGVRVLCNLTLDYLKMKAN